MNTTLAPAPTLEEILVDALIDTTIKSYALADLVDECKNGIVTAENDAKIAKAAALDPLQSPDPVTARATMEDASFRADRLRSLLPRLQQCLTAVGDHEEIMAWHERFDPLALKVEAAATKLATVYAKVTAELVPLFTEIERLDAEVVRTLSAKPRNASGYLRSVELTARGFQNFQIGSHEIMKMQFPDWHRPTELVWPPNRQIDWSGVVPTFPKHSGADWWKAQEAEAATKAAKADQANAEQTQADGAARETRFHDLSDWGMKEV
jgi:hypothetical protein